jgi:K+ transporter
MAIKYANRVPAARAAAHRDAAARERVRRMGARKPARPPPGGRRDLHGRRFGHTARPDATHHLRHNRVLHERVLLVSTVSSDAPRVDPELRVKLAPVGAGITRVTLHFGFMEHPDVMEGLKLACRDPSLLGIDPERITFYSRRVMVVPSGKVPGMAVWRERLFEAMHLNANLPAAYFGVPTAQVVEVGLEVEI